jgi:two-component system, OmpR family, response regulator RegX3
MNRSETRPCVLVVEDEPSFADALGIALTREGFQVVVAVDGIEAIERFGDVDPDIVLLDVMLPRMSGVDVCRVLRARSSVPIVMVTARSTELDAVVGLEIGADDYVTKPYRLRELVARVRAVLRRSELRSAVPDGAPSARIAVGDVSIDLERYEVSVRGELVRLPLKEFQVLTLLLQHAGRVLTRDVIIDRAWGSDYHGDTKTLDVHIKRLRSKIEEEPHQPTRILTIRGLGYRYEMPRG